MQGPAQQMIEIVIADDHSLTREGLKIRVSKEDIDLKVVHEASDAAELAKILARKPPDIVVLDISLPDKNGLDVLKHIKINYPSVEVIILSMHPEERYGIRAYKAGASGYLSKDNENLSRELIKAVRMIVTENRRYVNQKVASQLAEYIHNTNSRKYRKLSDREFQVFCLIASGKKTADVAKELSVSVQTVYTYRNRAKEKLNLETTADFTKYALQHNLID